MTRPASLHCAGRALLTALLAGRLLLGTACSVAAADTPPPVADSRSFGRLFHTTAERRQLDRGSAAVKQPLPSVLPAVRVDGIVRSSTGTVRVWLDGHSLPLPSSLRLAPHPAVELKLPAHPQQRLRAGDRWQPGTPDLTALRQLWAAKHRLPAVLAEALKHAGEQ